MNRLRIISLRLRMWLIARKVGSAEYETALRMREEMIKLLQQINALRFKL